MFTVRAGRDAAELAGELSGPRTSRPCSSTPATRHPKRLLPGDELAELGNCRTEPMLRLEILMQRLLSEHGSCKT